MYRCLKCGCSRTDARGFLSCVLCGAACGDRTEQCYVTDDTKAILLAHAEELKDFGLTLEQHRLLAKDAKTTIAAIGLVIQIAHELRPGGMLRDLILYLHELAITRDEILRLRLTEPEVSSILRLGPLRYSNLAHLDIDILPHFTGVWFGRPGGSEAWRPGFRGAV